MQQRQRVRTFIIGLRQQTISRVFRCIYGVVLLLALFPPFYLFASGARQPVVLGLPFGIAYWIFDAALLGVALWVFYLIEGLRGELVDDEQKASEVL